VLASLCVRRESRVEDEIVAESRRRTSWDCLFCTMRAERGMEVVVMKKICVSLFVFVILQCVLSLPSIAQNPLPPPLCLKFRTLYYPDPIPPGWFYYSSAPGTYAYVVARSKCPPPSPRRTAVRTVAVQFLLLRARRSSLRQMSRFRDSVADSPLQGPGTASGHRFCPAFKTASLVPIGVPLTKNGSWWEPTTT